MPVPGVRTQAIRNNLGPMSTDQTIAPFAAAVYTPDTADRMALLKFVEKLKSLNIRVGGVLQEALFDSAGASMMSPSFSVTPGKGGEEFPPPSA